MKNGYTDHMYIMVISAWLHVKRCHEFFLTEQEEYGG